MGSSGRFVDQPRGRFSAEADAFFESLTGAAASRSQGRDFVESSRDGTSPAELFDALFRGESSRTGLSFDELGEETWEVVAGPGEAVHGEAARPGDVVVRRAWGEGRLAALQTVGEDIDPEAVCGYAGHLPADCLLLRSSRHGGPPYESWAGSEESIAAEQTTCLSGSPMPALLAAGSTPLTSGLMAAGSHLASLYDVFQGSSSNRNLDWVDGLDGLTIGFGHWAAGGMPGLLTRWSGNSAAWRALVDRMCGHFSSDTASWTAFLAEAGLASGTALTYANIEAGLRATLWNATWRAKWSTSSPATSLAFISTGLATALRDPRVAQLQVEHWTREIVEDGQTKAVSIDIDTFGGHASMASLESSAPAWASLLVTLAGRGTVSVSIPAVTSRDSSVPAPTSYPARTCTWNWNTPPSSVGSSALQDWRALVVWQYYWARKLREARQRYNGLTSHDSGKWDKVVSYSNRNRSRMRRIWSAWYRSVWGSAPTGNPCSVPSHSGSMATGRFLP